MMNFKNESATVSNNGSVTRNSRFLKCLIEKSTLPANICNTSIEVNCGHMPSTSPAEIPHTKNELVPGNQLEIPKPEKSISTKAKVLTKFFKRIVSKSVVHKRVLHNTQVIEDNNEDANSSVVPTPSESNTSTVVVHTDASKDKFSATTESETSTISSALSYVTAEDNFADELAQRIWDQDKLVYSDFDHIVEWIGNGKPTSTAILKSYMSHYKLENVQLEEAFRDLCSKLHLKGETQQIDRVLAEFSLRYYECNPNCIYTNSDVVHAIVYSLLLLNTDIHLAQGGHKRMAKTEFIENTMHAICTNSDNLTQKKKCHIYRKSCHFSFQSLQVAPLSRSTSVENNLKSYARSFNSSIMSKSSWDMESKEWQADMRNTLKQMYISVFKKRINDPTSCFYPTETGSFSRKSNHSVGVSFKKGFGSLTRMCGREMKSIAAGHIDILDEHFAPSFSSSTSSALQYELAASHIQNPDLPSVYTSNAPYYKEGITGCKHLLESSAHKAHKRVWKSCFMVIERSRLCMYKLEQSSSDSATISHSNDSVVFGGGDWISSARLIDSIDLKHTLASVLPSGYSSKRPFAFALQQSNGGVYIFEAGSSEQVSEWVSTCNYWASRESKKPLIGAVGSMEYGWGNCLETEKEGAIIHKWQAPMPPTVICKSEEAVQLETLYEHMQQLTQELEDHHNIKTKMTNLYSNSKLANKVISNWDNKSFYLLHEIIKYQHYCDSIKNSLSLQASILAAL